MDIESGLESIVQTFKQISIEAVNIALITTTIAFAIPAVLNEQAYSQGRQRIQRNEDQNKISVDYAANSATLKFKHNSIKIIKDSQGNVTYTVNNRSSTKLRFKNNYTFKENIAKRLDHEIGKKNRPFIGKQLDEIYTKLNLKSTIKRDGDNSGIERKVTPGILDADIGVYTLDSQSLPLSYLLVRNSNTGSYYCLSLVQEVFDMIYGLGEAKRIGLLSNAYAEGLNFTGAPAKVENYQPTTHSNLKKGTIMRLVHGRAPGYMTSIAISLGNGKAAHIIGGELYIEPQASIMNDGWGPQQIITPDDSFKERESTVLTYNEIFGRKSKTLEQISPVIKKQLRLNGNLASIEEQIYQLNKDKFQIKEGSNYGYFARLKTPTKLIVPEYWINRKKH